MKSLTELRKLKKHSTHQQISEQLSIELGYCPKCGSKMIVEKRIRWFDSILGQWKQTTFCPKEKSHYYESGTYFYDSGF